jgi:bacillithiol synthase
MKLEQIQLPVTNLLYADYIANKDKTHEFFEYHQQTDDFVKRAQYLQTKTYQFEKLAQTIEQYMEPFGISEKVQANIDLLRKGAYAIVGGQQAGILTGPLYSVHKAITVLLLAKKQSESLRMPIVPIFWIAGEDHDIEEINHTYTMAEGQIKKRAYSIRNRKKTMASETVFDKAEMEQSIRQIFSDYGETQFTNEIFVTVQKAIRNSKTFTDLFTSLMNDLFKQYGLLMIDAANESFRRLQSDYFVKLIENSEAIAANVYTKEQRLVSVGYPMPIQANEKGVNLFFVQDGERHLLEWEDGFAKNKAAQLKFTKAQLIEIAKEKPHYLSNNVVTRPLMQDMILPVLAFVGGPGELAYWATLKPAFEQLQLQMPIFTPRMQFTIVTRQVASILNEQGLTVEDVFNGKSAEQLKQFLVSIEDEKANDMIENLQQLVVAQYDKLCDHLQQQSVDVSKVIAKNELLHIQQFDYLKRKISEQVKLKHDIQIKRYEKIHHELTPFNGLQERIYNPYKYINESGISFIDRMMETDIELDYQHKVIFV